MSVTRDEFKQFEKRLDERHDEELRWRAELRAQLANLPCSVHRSDIDEIKAQHFKIAGAVAAVVVGFELCREFILGRLGLK